MKHYNIDKIIEEITSITKIKNTIFLIIFGIFDKKRSFLANF